MRITVTMGLKVPNIIRFFCLTYFEGYSFFVMIKRIGFPPCLKAVSRFFSNPLIFPVMKNLSSPYNLTVFFRKITVNRFIKFVNSIIHVLTIQYCRPIEDLYERVEVLEVRTRSWMQVNFLYLILVMSLCFGFPDNHFVIRGG